MNGREKKQENDLFFVCSVIEYIGRKTKNKRGDIVNKLGVQEISRLMNLADVLHSEALESTACDLITKYGIVNGDFDNLSVSRYSVPTHFDIAKVYKRLIIDIATMQNVSLIDALIAVYGSWITDKIDNYNSSMYFENPQYIYASYSTGMPI
ncbi:MAG: hypothetical protein LBV09_00010 [Deferribacteraceae bacterium]|jgi:hypothetical protein|nr:hypothetical protein [Deferribacteraceae bacterium]